MPTHPRPSPAATHSAEPPNMASNMPFPLAGADFVAMNLVAHSAPTAHSALDQYLRAGGFQLAAAMVQGEESPATIWQALDERVAQQWREVAAQALPRTLVVELGASASHGGNTPSAWEHDPYRLMEGVLIAAQVVGTERVVLRLPAPAPQHAALLEQVLAALEACPPCPLPDWSLQWGAACGAGAPNGDGAHHPTLHQNGEALLGLRDRVQRGPRNEHAPAAQTVGA